MGEFATSESRGSSGARSGTGGGSPHSVPSIAMAEKNKKKREKLLFGSVGEASGAAGDARLLRGRAVAKRQRQDVLDGGPAINPCILAKRRLFLKVCVSDGSGEHWGWGELVWD